MNHASHQGGHGTARVSHAHPIASAFFPPFGRLITLCIFSVSTLRQADIPPRPSGM